MYAFITNLDPEALQSGMLGGGTAMFNSLKPILMLLPGGYIAFYIISWIIKIVINWSMTKRESREKDELEALGQELGFKIERKDSERIQKEKRFKELSKNYKDEYDVEELDDDDDE